jgi:ATP-binding cassette, subfamily C (CFTR/MRP), member 1
VPTRTSLAAAALTFVSSLALLALSYLEHLYSYRPSTIINLFLLFSALFDATQARTLWLQTYNRPVAIASLISVIVKLVALTLEAVEKRHILRPQYQDLTPESTSGILSQWLFTWQIPLFRAGYSKTLGMDDLFHLDKHLKSTLLHAKLHARTPTSETPVTWHTCAGANGYQTPRDPSMPCCSTSSPVSSGPS